MNASLFKYNNSRLLARFREFYGEVCRQAEMVRTGKERSADAVFKRLRSFLEQQTLEAGATADEMENRIRQEARYVMVVLADEIFLHLPWVGRDQWFQQLLEREFFHTCAAGEIFFERLNEHLRNHNSMFADLAAVYLYALALGFQGRYRGLEAQEELEGYRQRLFQLIANREPRLLSREADLFPDARGVTPDLKERKKSFPSVHRWALVLALVILGFFGVSHVLWMNVTRDMKKILDRVPKDSQSLVNKSER